MEVFWLRMMWFESRMSEVRSWPLWSVKGECHVCEWALKSPVRCIFVVMSSMLFVIRFVGVGICE